MKRVVVTTTLTLCLLLAWAIGTSHAAEQTKEELLAILQEFDDAFNAHDADWLLSLFTDDALFEVVGFPPMNKEEDRIFIEGYWSSNPSVSNSEAFALVSVSDKVGLTEHYTTSVWPDNGVPTASFHIDIWDFEGDRLKRLTVYVDFATGMIQAGVMPPRNLGDMIPSFTLPASEATGLAPLEASTELTARLNAHDLPSLAKMVKENADIRFPYIDRPANRAEFIDLYEQILTGFPDAEWENTRSVDMGDGWVVSEATLRGTNTGLFLGKPATGLPMEVRAGWVERYDEKGLATYLHFHFDTLSMPGQEAPTEPAEDFSNVFFMSLSEGLNMVSLPLKPQTSYNARSFADMLSATVVIKLDEARQRFVGFTLDAPDDGFAIEGGKGYIVNVPEDKTVAFTGATWTNQPPVEAAPTLETDSAWAFVVSGNLNSPDGNGWHGGAAPTDYTIQAQNLRTGAITTDLVSKSGYFALASADLSRQSIIQTGDRLEIIAKDAFGNVVSKVVRTIDADDIGKAYLNVSLRLRDIIPSKTLCCKTIPTRSTQRRGFHSRLRRILW